MRRRGRRILLSIAALLALALGAGAWEFVLSRGRTPPIVGADGSPVPGSVAALEELWIGGAKQWVLVRGRDRTKPVVLFVHGGPGMPAMYLAHAWQRALEDDFVVVHWDRRGTGKSWRAEPAPGTLGVRRTLDDLLELTDVLRSRFGQDRIYLLGHSWGSYLGLLAVRERPERFLAFIGTGQMAGSRADVAAARRALLAPKAAADGDAALAERLRRPGAEPTEDELFRHGGELHGATSIWPLLAAGLRAPEYDLRDVLELKGAADRVNRAMRNDVLPRPLEGEIPRFDVPVFFLLGRFDMNTPSDLAAAYLDRLEAPRKGVEWLEGSAHFPFFEEPERFRAAMLRVDAAVRRFWSDAAAPADLSRRVPRHR